MAKNTEDYKLNENSEYASDENFEAPTSRPAPSAGKMGSIPPRMPPGFPIKNKKMAVIIGLFVGLFFIMQVVKLFSSGSKEKIKEQQVTSAAIQEPDLQSSSIRVLNEKYSSAETKIQQLQKDVDDTRSSIAEMNKSMYDLNITVQQLTAEIHKIISEKAAVQETMKGKKTPYHVRAIVNGRAWLETDNGINTITVRTGSNLGRYGKVKEVDDRNGVVTTDKGAIIRYGKNDM
jgi:hypothetical protein